MNFFAASEVTTSLKKKNRKRVSIKVNRFDITKERRVGSKLRLVNG